MSQSSRLARTIPELLQFRGQQTPKLNAFHRLNENAVWVARNWESIINDVLSLSGSLDLRGVSKGDNVIIFAPSSLEWEIMHHAVLLTGAVVIGLEPHASTEYIRAAFDTARPQHLVVQDEELLKKIPAEYTHTLSNTILLSNWSSLLQEKHPSFVPPLLSPEDPATMVFSSGSTGKPKGIIYQHQQILAACRSYENSFPSINEIRGVCWLPLANLFQRMHNLALMSSGGEIYFVDKPTTISEHLPSINPTILD
jgi:long-chain acyl-CoA synthetase